MKIETRDIPAFLKSGPRSQRAVLLYGPDEGKVRDWAKTLVTATLGTNPDPMNIVELNGKQIDDDPARLQDEMCSMSLLGGDRIVLLRTPERSTTNVIKDALENAVATTKLIILAEDLGKDSALRSFAEKSPHVATLAAYADEGAQLGQVIRDTLTAANVRVSPEAMQHLLAHLGNNRAVTRSELEKILLYLGAEKELSLATAQLLVGENTEVAMQDVAMAVAGGEMRRIPPLLRRLWLEGEAPVAVVRSTLRYFQKLHGLQSQIATGVSEEAALRSSRTFFKHVPLLKRHLGRWPLAKLLSALERLHGCERDLKGVIPIAPELLAARILMGVASSGTR